MNPAYTRHDLSRFLIHSLEHYMLCAKTEPKGLNKWGDPVLKAMREAVPVPGRSWDRESHVILEHGQAVAAHTHPEYVALWYVDLGDPPQPLYIEGQPVTPFPGECIVLAPGILHSVSASTSKRTRLTFAMLVPDSPRKTLEPEP